VDLLISDLAALRQRGSIVSDSRDIIGITDIAAPVILSDGRAIASLIVAYLNRRETKADYQAVLSRLKETCAEISDRLEQLGFAQVGRGG
jgi:DNA-binding IclR family transcriptional regulator